MKPVSAKILVVIVLSMILAVTFAGSALAAPPWIDAPNSWWISSYGVTDTEVATVADGFPDGTFKPGNAVTRGQFAKMAVDGLGLPTADPAIATFLDVPKGSIFFTFVEGAKAAGLINGTSPTAFSPNNNITRQQTNSILGRYLSQAEIEATGVIHGSESDTYGSLGSWYGVWGSFYLDGFEDANKIAAEHRPTTAYLIFRGVVHGSDAKLNPTATLSRGQAAAMVLRAADVAAELTTPPPAPTGLVVTPAGPGNDPTPQVSGSAIPNSPIGLYDTFNGTTTLITTTSTNAAGLFYADVTTILADGMHVFTAKAKNVRGIISPPSLPVAYILDTVAPTGSISAPMVSGGDIDAPVKLAKPAFTATAVDERSGVNRVEFQVAKDEATPTWQSVFVDTVPNTGTSTYSADWPTTGDLAAGLPDGQYLFKVVMTDNAGNTTTSASVKVTVDTTAPTAAIAAGSLEPQASGGGSIFYTEDPQPLFGATTNDVTGGAVGTLPSGVVKVEFLYALIGSSPDAWNDFTLISADLGTSGFASYPPAGIPDGHYLFATRATDRAGNESVWNGAIRQVVIDNLAPVVNITAPAAGALLPDATNYTITWTLTDVSAPTAVLIEYSPTGADGSWTTIAAAAPFTPGLPGSYLWTSVPDIGPGDVMTNRIRITAADRAGMPVGDVAGHTTVATSGVFTLYDAPVAAANVVGSDPDSAFDGIDWHDFHATWTISASPHIASQRVFLLPSGQTPNLTVVPVDVPVASFQNNTTAEWTSTNELVTDSRGGALSAIAYKVWIISTDLAGRMVMTQSADFTPAAP